MKKKGMFFSLISISLILILIVSFKLTTESKLEENKIRSTQLRVKMLNDFINSMEDSYFENMLKISSQTALDALAQYKSRTKKSLNINTADSVPGNFETVMLFGYIKDNSGSYCEDNLCKEYSSRLSDAQLARYKPYQFRKIDFDLDPAKPVMANYAFFDLLGSIEKTLESLGVETNSFDIKIENLQQTDNWNIKVKATMDYYFTDKNKNAAWRGRTTKEVSLTILGIQNPLSEPGVIIDKSWKIDVGGVPCGGKPICFYNYPSFLNRLQDGLDSSNIYGICKKDEDCDTS